jgi:hypothetical protein
MSALQSSLALDMVSSAVLTPSTISLTVCWRLRTGATVPEGRTPERDPEEYCGTAQTYFAARLAQPAIDVNVVQPEIGVKETIFSA